MNKLKLFSMIIALLAILNSCNEDYLERYPLDEVSTQDYFKTPKDLETYMNQFYCFNSFPIRYGPVNLSGLNFPNTGYVSGEGDDFWSDNAYNDNSPSTRLLGTRTINDGGWSWTRIRDVNFFFDHYEKCQGDFSTYQQYVGEAHFFRALLYFRFLKSHGAVPWLSKTLQTNSEELYAPRDPRHIVADNIIADLDKAAQYCSAAKGNGFSRINKWIALQLQSRVALYEGTWQKYHAGTVFAAEVSDPQKYLNKAAAAAKEIMDSGLYGIYSTGNPDEDYYNFHSTLRTYDGNPEVLFWTKFSIDLNFTNTRNYDLLLPRDLSITKQLADAYLCNDGLPISVSPLYRGDNTMADEAIDRDPRFKQQIFTPDAIWQIELSGNIRYYTEVINMINDGTNPNRCHTGYQNRKWYNPREQFRSQNYEENPQITYRYAEVLLNYAEAKAELGTITPADLDLTINKLRDRVAMPHLRLDNITVDPNWDFPSLSPIINEVRRERRVELAYEGFRTADILRWAAAKELIVGKRPLGAKNAQFPGSKTTNVNSNGYLDPFLTRYPDGWQFKLDRDYLDPVPQAQITMNKNLTQNPGWQ
jgi:hypothetical protein